ncbi:MAG: hypothetical protein D6831_02720 [Aquificota bacterium]|nr:MAG: hypothetical protein D6831_02720 [Aquificota bacterium]
MSIRICWNNLCSFNIHFIHSIIKTINEKDIHYNENEVEKIKKILQITKGNKSLAAKMLGIHRTTLWRKIKEYNINF